MGLPQGDAQQHRPGQDADVVGVHQGVHRVGHQIHQQGVEHLADAAGGGGLLLGGGELQGHREQEAGDHRHTAVDEGAQQVEHNDPGHVGLLPLLVAGQGGHHQKQHQDGGHRLQGPHEQVAQQGHGCGLGRRQPQNDAEDQAAQDPQHQAGVVPPFQQIFHAFSFIPSLFIWNFSITQFLSPAYLHYGRTAVLLRGTIQAGITKGSQIWGGGFR